MDRIATKAMTVGGILLSAGIALKSCFFTVDAGHKGIIFDRFFGDGIKPQIYDEGMHFLIPFV